MKYISPFKNKFYIYKIINSVNNKIYIGRTKNPPYRYRGHLSVSLNLNNSLGVQKIHLAIRELGDKNFIFEVFEECEDYYDACKRELYWIKFYQSDEDEFGYNDKVGSQNTPNLSDEDRRRLSLRMTGSNNPMFGKSKSLKILQKLSHQFSGSGNPFYGKTHSEEIKKIIGKSSKGRAAGENNPHAKLNMKIVSQIRDDWKTGLYTKVILSKKYNVTAATIGNIISGKTWGHNEN